MRNRILTTLMVVVLISQFTGAAAQEEIPAFPGAEGFAAYARGGRGGDVYILSLIHI